MLTGQRHGHCMCCMHMACFSLHDTSLLDLEGPKDPQVHLMLHQGTMWKHKARFLAWVLMIGML